ncbi:unnamed protein product [Meganyctiphanes norvegica]|uniref:Uncharacterized protein n=1 Tax=Meganyctiphanes norvegica TaxID=48144 RepID=A0AAV2SWT5_MEGNR
MLGILKKPSVTLSKCFWLRIHFHHSLTRKAVKFKYEHKKDLFQNAYASYPVNIFVCNSSNHILHPNIKVSQSLSKNKNLPLSSLDKFPQPSSKFEEEISVIADTEEPLPSMKLKQENIYLFKSIKAISDAEDLLQFYEDNSGIMNDQHSIEALAKLKNLVTQGKENASIIKENPIFVKLAHSIWKCSPTLDTDELLTILGSLIVLEVPARSKIIQKILQLLRNSMNNMNEKEVVFFYFLLGKLPCVGLTKMLKEAIPLLLDNLMQHEIKDVTLTLNDYSKMLAIYANGGGGNISALLTEIYEHGAMTVNDPVKSILWNILDAQNNLHTLTKEENEKINVLTEECLEVLATCLDKLKVGEIIKTLHKLGTNHGRKNPSRLNLNFFNSVTLMITSAECRIRAKCRILSFCKKLGYVSITLNHHIIDEILKYSEEALTITDNDFDDVIRALAIAGHDHPNLFQSLDILMQHKKVQEKEINKYWLNTSLDLLALDYVNNEIVHECVDKKNIKKYFTDYSLNLLLFDQTLALKKTNFRVPEEFLMHGKKLCLDFQPKPSKLSNLLIQIFGDDQFIPGVITNECIYIDHLLIMNSCGQIESIKVEKQNKTGITVNDIEITSSSQVIAILDVPPRCVLMPSDQVISTIRLKQQILEANGYIVLLILDNVLQRLTDIEQSSFIKAQLTSIGANLI